MRAVAAVALSIAALAACAACDKPGDARTDAAAPVVVDAAVASQSEAPIDARDGGLLARRLPKLKYLKGPFLKHARLVTVAFAQDDPKIVATIERFADQVFATSWWKAVTEGLCATPGECIGAGKAAGHVRLADKLETTIDQDAIEDILARGVKEKRFGTIDDDTLVMVFLPENIALTSGKRTFCKPSPRAYHTALRKTGGRIAYAVVPRCGDESELTGAASHELLESVTNPDPEERGFSFDGDDMASGFTIAGREPVDPCGLMTMDSHWTFESGLTLQRAWSNAAAAAAKDPCVPSRAGRPFMMMVPRNTVLRLAKPGDSLTVELDASTGSTAIPSWSIAAFDVTGFRSHDEFVDLTLDRRTVVAGNTAVLRVRLLKPHPQGVVIGVTSTFGTYSHMWPLHVVTH